MTDIYEEEIYSVKQVFKRNCFGVILSARGKDDPHVCFTIIVEDDGNWFVSKNGQSSSFWLPELIGVLAEVDDWLADNCTKESGGFGWDFT